MTYSATVSDPARVCADSSKSTTILSGLVVAGAALLAIGAGLQPWVDPKLLFMDMIAAAQASGYCCKVYWAFLSNLGVVAWCITAAVTGFAALLLWGGGKPSRAALALALAGALSLTIALDDLLMLHESVLPGFGLSQTAILLIYAGLGGAYALVQWRILLSEAGFLLVLAMGLFGLSVGVDVVVHSTSSAVVAIEDGLKFVGIVSWMMFHIVFALREASMGVAYSTPAR